MYTMFPLLGSSILHLARGSAAKTADFTKNTMEQSDKDRQLLLQRFQARGATIYQTFSA